MVVEADEPTNLGLQLQSIPEDCYLIHHSYTDPAVKHTTITSFSRNESEKKVTPTSLIITTRDK